MANKIILVVEDNDITRQGLTIMLEADGFTVLSACHGLEALERMQPTCPDLILCDIAMPYMNGYDLFNAVQAHPEWVALPFIFLTARGMREEVFSGKKLGVEDYLVKPINRRELLTTVRSRLTRSEQLQLIQLQQSYEASLLMLGNAIELRDQYTRKHVERVLDFSAAIGKQLDLTSEQFRHLKFGSILHDIGKIYISESVLCKPGRLNPEEWEEMKRHPIVGADLLTNVDYLKPSLPIILHHHERWDGNGYPDGLAGEAIPLLARIVSVADSLDAVSSDRPYHKALDTQQTYDEILLGAKTRYDPTIIEAFQQAWDEGDLILH